MAHLRTALLFTLVFVLLLPALAIGQSTISIWAGMDNTLYEDGTGSLSNGKGSHFFVGKTGGRDGNHIRRGLVYFDVASGIPAGATILEVTLTLNCSKSAPGSGNQTVFLHRVTASWGEGTSNAGGAEGAGTASTTGDATWIHRFFNTDAWTTPGGDFMASASASLAVGGTGMYTWGSTTDMVADVQAWLDNPTENFGWIVIGNESASQTARRFDTWENSNATNHPMVEVTYDASSCVECDPNDPPGTFVLLQNYPNPFNPTTRLRFDLAETAEVRLDIVNAAGQVVRTLMDGEGNAGSHVVEWDGRNGRGLPAQSGVYYGILSTGTDVRTLKMLLAK